MDKKIPTSPDSDRVTRWAFNFFMGSLALAFVAMIILGLFYI